MKIRPIQLQILASQYNEKSRILKLQLSDTVYKSHTVYVKTAKSEIAIQYGILEIADYDLIPIEIPIKPNRFEKYVKIFIEIDKKIKTFIFIHSRYKMIIKNISGVNNQHLIQIGSPEYLPEQIPSMLTIENAEDREENNGLKKSDQQDLVDSSVTQEEETPILSSSDFVNPDDLLKELGEIDQQNLGGNAVEENDQSETINQQISNVGNQEEDIEMDDDDKLLSQIPDEILNETNVAMMKDLFVFFEKDIKKLKEEVQKVSLKKGALLKQLTSIMKDKQKIQTKIDVAEKELAEMQEEIFKLNSLIAGVEAKKKIYLKNEK